MAYWKKQKIGEAVNNKTFQKETVKEVLTYPIKAVPERGLSQEEAEYYEIRSSLSTEDGKTITATYYPYYNKEGKITGFKKRDWTKPKEEDGHFSVVGSVKVSSKLFGQQKCGQRGRALYICEGEDEVWAARKAILESLKGTKWEGKITPDVVGLNCGCANAQEAIAHNEEFVRGYSEVVLCLNNDSATPRERAKGIKKGKEATEDIAAYLLSDNISVVEIVEGCNDIREALNKGHGVEMGKALAFGRKKYSPEKIVSGDDVSFEELTTPIEEGLIINRFPRLMQKLHGFRLGELNLYAAFSGVGKSTLSREIAWEMINFGETCGFIFLEEPRIKTQQALLCLEMGVKLPQFRKDPYSVATEDQIREAKAKVLSNGRTFFLDHFGSLKVEKLMEQVKYLHFICGCRQIFIDHISMVVSGSTSDNERKDIDVLLTELAAFVSSHPVTIHAVSHLKRVDETPPKLKAGEAPQPYWREVKKEMLRGSGGLEQLAFNIICLENEVLPNGERGRVRTKIEKSREWGETGICDVMKMKEDGRLHLAYDSF